jgi:hypothetical protein
VSRIAETRGLRANRKLLVQITVLTLTTRGRGHFGDLYAYISTSMALLKDSPLPARRFTRQRHKKGFGEDLHLVVNHNLGVGLACSVNCECQRLPIRRDFKFRVVHYFALHLVGDIERVCVDTLA